MTIAILSILFTMIILMVRVQLSKAQDARGRKSAEDIVTSLTMYREDSELGLFPIATDPIATLTESLGILTQKGYLSNDSVLNVAEGRYISFDGETYSLAMQMGNKTYDLISSGNGYYKSISRSVDLVKPSPALDFKGTDPVWVQGGGTNNVTPFTVNTFGRYVGDSWVYSVWLKPDALPAAGQKQALMSRMSFYTDSPGAGLAQKITFREGWSISLKDTGQLRLYACRGGLCYPPYPAAEIDFTTNLATPISTSDWTHVALRISKNRTVALDNSPQFIEKAHGAVGSGEKLSFALYVNGVNVTGSTLVDKIALPWTQYYTSANINLSGPKGTSASDFQPFVGKLDDFRMYGTALSAAQISDIYNGGQGKYEDGKGTGLSGLWKMDKLPFVGVSATTTEDSFVGAPISYHRFLQKALAAPGSPPVSNPDVQYAPNNAVLSPGVYWTVDGHVPQGVSDLGTEPDGRAYVIYGQ